MTARPTPNGALLAAFRRTYPAATVEAAGRPWEIIDAGEGRRALLVLPGALGVAEASWMTIRHFAAPDALPRLRVLAPTYPHAIDSMAALADGIAALLDAVDVGSVALFGASYGGLVAQSFARRHPARVERLILSHTGAPEPARAGSLARSLRVLGALPESWLKSMLNRQLHRSLRDVDDALARVTTTHMRDVVQRRMTKASILTGYRRVADFDATWEEQPNEPYGGPTLLLFGALDSAIPAAVREALQMLYPQASVVLFKESGHATAITEYTAYYSAVASFLT